MFAWYTHLYLPEPRLSWLIKNHECDNKVRAYLACIRFVDAQIGKVLDALRESRFKNNTIVVLWSDHGYHLGEKDITGKNTLWERSTHVPLIVTGPGIQGHRQCHERSEEHTSELQSLMRISYAVFCLKKKNTKQQERLTKRIT